MDCDDSFQQGDRLLRVSLQSQTGSHQEKWFPPAGMLIHQTLEFVVSLFEQSILQLTLDLIAALVERHIVADKKEVGLLILNKWPKLRHDIRRIIRTLNIEWLSVVAEREFRPERPIWFDDWPRQRPIFVWLEPMAAGILYSAQNDAAPILV